MINPSTGSRIIWLSSTVKAPKRSARELQTKDAEITTLKSLLDAHIDELDRAEAEIKDFIDWTDKSVVSIPHYATSGLRAFVK